MWILVASDEQFWLSWNQGEDYVGKHDDVDYLFMVYLTTLSVSDYIVSKERMVVSNELEVTLKQVVVA
jgi:hypothetical protein